MLISTACVTPARLATASRRAWRGSPVWLSTAILAGSFRACKGLEGTEARSLHICTLEGDFLPEELTDQGLKLLQPSAAIRCLTSGLSGAACPRPLEPVVGQYLPYVSREIVPPARHCYDEKTVGPSQYGHSRQ